MTAQLRQLMHDCERLGYVMLSYHRGCFYVAGYGVRDVSWCVTRVRRHIPAKAR